MSRDFWSKRKAAVEAERQEEAAQAQAAQAAELSERSDQEILEELGLPDPDTLKDGDDFKAFLNQAIPARIRTRALRRLWRVNPVLANVDGLVDYGDDFSSPSLIMENIQTAYQVGKGMTEHVLKLAQPEEEPQDISEQDILETEVVELDETPEPETILTQGKVDSDFDVSQDDAPEIVPPSRRRMRFEFDETGSQA